MSRRCWLVLWCLWPLACPAATPAAHVRFVNGLLDERAFDYDLCRLPAARALAHGEVSAYATVTPGRSLTSCRLADAETALWESPLDYTDGWHTVLSLGTGKQATPVLLSDAVTPPSAQQARLRLVGASNGLPGLEAELTSSAGSWRSGRFRPGEATSYLTVPAGEYRLTLHRAVPGAKLGPRLKTIPCLPLAGRSVYSGFTFGEIGGQAPWQQMRAVVQLDGPLSP